MFKRARLPVVATRHQTTAGLLIREGDIEQAILRPKNPRHQLLDAKSAIDEAKQGGTTFLHVAQGHPRAKHRQIQEHATLGVFLGFLTQDKLCAERHIAAAKSQPDGRPPRRLAEHVIAQRPPIAPIERADVVDQHILIARARRKRSIVHAPVGLHPGQKVIEPVLLDMPRPAQCHDAGIAILQAQLLDGPVPLLQSDLLTADHQPGNAAQDHFVGTHATEHTLPDILSFELKTLLAGLPITGFERLPLPDDAAPEAEQQHQGNPDCQMLAWNGALPVFHELS
ncbi:hypothetical protein D3C85_1092480 [compost metagenome]